MRIKPSSATFTLLLGLLAAVPSFGLDMSLPALAATGADLDASASDVGLTISAFMLSLAAAPLVYGPASDYLGRKPVVIFGCALFVVASIGCAVAQSLSALLTWRLVQGAGAAGTTITLAIIRDLFDAQAARAKTSYVIIAINTVPMVAPTAGAALLTLGGWRLIYTALLVVGLIVLLAVSLGFRESARIDPAGRLTPSVIARNYFRVLTHRICLGYILVNASAFAAIFAYASGSSLFFINVVGLRPDVYGLIFGASAAAVMGGAFLDGRLLARGISPFYPLMIGLALLAVCAIGLLAMTLAGWMPLPLVISLMIAAAFAFGLVTPNAMNGAMQPLPQIAGAAGAAAGSIQILAGAVSSGVVAICFDGHSALSMTAVMASCSILALACYLLIARPAERVALSP
ncbi:drug resistance transporter, Bcr/CflA subfamily [Methylocella silvestris BL2]|uniref:Bcr/CflA family efflux transporter n=1 Tax=Methylocella silvestris (strain DSM 15510 / CIP 108128 / LMG 27833 / NCIMB 13906 / BL2) TaxID=395965 RepID=B8EMV1_METSB|nr:multidrug effflux MFS transporter [Methylocella silvestris]ACK52780.1 drug resistance transporter, Bcr/CflA subfamily [Methylocella silvestris BL2]